MEDNANCIDIVMNLIALIVVPIVAVLIGQCLQTRAKKRDDKMRIFETLITSRVFGLNEESVRAYNLIHIVFADEKDVRKKWVDYYKSLCVENPSETQLAESLEKQTKLLKAMASSLGYTDELSQEALDIKYIPKGLAEAAERQKKQQYDYGVLLRETANRFQNGQPLPPI